MPKADELKKIASQIRRDIVRMVHGASSGHPGGSLGCTDLFTALFFEILDHNPKNFDMNGTGQDIFFLSNGHISPAFYSALARSGYFPVSELGTFRKIHSRLQGHPATMEGLPGIRVASGSLGQGLSVSIGAANAKKLNNDPKLVFCLMGDGELNEGQVWEAAMYAGSKKVDNLIAIVDHNQKQIDGPTDEVMPLGSLRAKFEAFEFKVLEMDGNDMDDIMETITRAKSETGKGCPVVIIMKTEMGMGVDFMMGTHKWHGVAPDDEQTEKALAQLEETLGDY
ncbi:MAG: transketolase [Marinilabiliales bacterium]|nr:MAG: transketolase [Marinilabiliales bacterium]